MEILKQILECESLHLIIGVIVISAIIYFNLFKVKEVIKTIIKFSVDFTKSLLLWLKPSFEDTTGQTSSRRLTAFAIIVTYITCRHNYASSVTDAYYLLLALIVDALFILLLFGIVTFQQIISLKENLKASGNLPKPPDDINKPQEEIK